MTQLDSKTAELKLNDNQAQEEAPKKKRIFTKVKFIAGLWFVAGTAAAFSIETGIDAALTNYFPEYFETDAKEIIESQNKHFDELKASLSDLKREVSSDEGKQLTKQIGSILSEAQADNRNLMISLDAIKQENNNLRRMLSQSKGIDGGTDIRILEGQAIKVDSATTIGVRSISNAYKTARLTITNNGETKKTELGVGSSAQYVSADNKTCTIAYLSESPKNMANFSRTCK